MSQEPLENTQPVELHQADTPEDTPTPTQDDFTTDIWASLPEEKTTDGDGQ